MELSKMGGRRDGELKWAQRGDVECAEKNQPELV